MFASPSSNGCFGYVVPEFIAECVCECLVFVHVGVAQVFECVVSLGGRECCEVVFDDVGAWFGGCWRGGQ